ncbi:TPA: hypothetical protein ACGO3G_001712 [Streptococcus suis]|jgi:hypothetical protein
MKTRKLLAVMATGVLATSLLVACSSNQSNSNQVQSVDEAKTVGFMQLANENTERIWFKVNDSNDDGEISKDDRVDRIFIIKDGKTDVFHGFDATLADFKDKSDKEVIDLIQQMDIKYVENEVEELIASINGKIGRIEDHIKELQDDEEYQNAPGFHKNDIDSANEEIQHYQKKITEVEKLEYNDIKSQYTNYTIKATAKTDSSGNNVASEEIILPEPFEFSRLYISDNPSQPRSLTLEVRDTSYEVKFPVQGDIYKKFYKGYQIDSSFFVTTSLDNSMNLGLDTLDTKNVTEE